MQKMFCIIIIIIIIIITITIIIELITLASICWEIFTYPRFLLGLELVRVRKFHPIL